MKQSLERVLTDPCPYCAGSGVIKSSSTICYEILTEVKKISQDLNGQSPVLRVNPDIARALWDEERAGMASLRGLWYRPRLLHDGSLASLEEMFDPARLDPDFEPQGWNPPGVDRRAVPGHRFGLTLPTEEKAALLAFLRSL